MPNHLAHENSPYLLQHANNPVDWYPWGEEALERAHNEDKPIFLSIGYAACHWCHVMEHESFEDEAIAAVMNASFINIKVDREERPDLDSIYMAATVSMTGSGGWPMSVFLTPDLRPFYTGTYFPPTPRFNMPSFRDLLMGISQAWNKQRPEIYKVGSQVFEHLKTESSKKDKAAWPLTHSLLANAADHLYQTYDWGFGGWGEAPKFPQPMTIDFLLSRATLNSPENNFETRHKYLKPAQHALLAMARGGMYDVVGGGFARYSVDNLWKTPHFEKMLYDNAQLAQTYLHAYLVTGEIKFRQICEETLDFILREMTHTSGGFYSSLDADSEGQEGKFYTWDYNDIEFVLGSDFEFFKTAYGLSPISIDTGNHGHGIEDKLILRRTLDDNALSIRFNLEKDKLNARLSSCHSQLLSARNQRVRPATDDKILTGWNALALTAFAEAGRYLSRPDYLQAATKNASFILNNLKKNGCLLRSWREGSAKHNAYLEDYASLILALLALYQSEPDTDWFIKAKHLAVEMVDHFSDPAGGFFDVRDDHETILMRPKDLQDNATPSGNALAALALLQLSEFDEQPEWRKIAEEMLVNILESAIRYPTAFAKWLCAADFALGPTRQVAIIGDSADTKTQSLLSTLWNVFNPRQISAISKFPPIPGAPLLLNDRPIINGQPTAYVCLGFVCQQPVWTAEDLFTLLK
jgi:uncharacterized protein YyaL (SSP411 family)